MVTLSKPTAQRADVTIWLQALDGTWEACGTNRMIGVVPESLVCDSDAWGSKTASFDLRRPVFSLWPDIAAFAPCMIEIGGVLRWRGRTNDTPIRDGVDPVINVQCEGSQVRLDDDVYQPLYVHSSLSDWRDARTSLSATLTTLTAAPQVQAGDGAISMTWPAGTATNGRAGVMLDLGPNCEAKRVVIDWSITAGAANRAAYFGYSLGPDAGTATTNLIYTATGASSGTYAFTLPTPCQYIFILHDANAHTPAADETLRVTRCLVFGETAYESGNVTILRASTVVGDAFDKATMLLSPDRSGIQATSFSLQDLAPDEERTPREMCEGVNAFHNWILQVDENDRPIFRPRPTAPLLEIGSWQGADLVDASANSGAEIYNRCITRGEGRDGVPVVVTRWDQTLAQTPSLSAVQLPYPSFDTNTSGWTVTDGVLTRTTTAGQFVTGPGGGKTGSEATTEFSTSVAGLDPGRRYELRFYTASPAGETTCDLQILITPTSADGEIVQQTFSSTAAAFALRAVRFTAPQSGEVVLRFNKARTSVGASSILLIDELRLFVGSSTVVDRRGFRRTFVLKPSFKITTTSGLQLADVFVTAHRTTPYKGSSRIMPGGARYVLGGSSPHPSALLTMTQELLCLSHRVDPDTGGVGRTATIASVKYTHRDESADVDLDDPRKNLDALMARMASVQGAGS
jgi:hypothetical protein